MKKPFTAVVKTWQACRHNRAWAGAIAEYINVKYKCLLTERHAHNGTLRPGFHQTWADHRWGQQAARGLGADRDHCASLPATDCITWTLMLPAGKYMLHLLDASFFPSVPPFCPSGEWTHLSHKPCLASLLLPHWGSSGPQGRSSSEVLPTKKAHTAHIFPGLSRAEQRVKKS